MIGASGTMRVASPPVMQQTVYPAPIEGMNAEMNLAEENPRHCLWCNNIIPDENGLRVRKGYRIWQEEVGGAGTEEEVRTVIVYYDKSGAADKIFACTTSGIWDVSTAGGTPSSVLNFSTSNTVSGNGVWIQYTTEAGADLILYADEENGLFTYTASTNTWAQTSGITTAAGSTNTFDATEIVFVANHKLRLWLVPKNANYAWYLPIRSIAGDAEEFFFAQKFRHGGELVGLYNWTVDGGLGRDDHLVAISRGGDVIPYTGEDPSDTVTWTSTGVFFVGPLPTKGRNLAAEHGGELFILSSFGLATLSDLLHGGDPRDPFRNKIGYRIGRRLRKDLADYRDDRPWEVSLLADQGLLLITTPVRSNSLYRQYSFTLATGGWGAWTDVPIRCSAMYDGHLMVGTSAGEVLRMDQTADDVQTDGTGRQAIQWAVLTSYSHLGAPALHKRVKFIRPNIISGRSPAYEARAYYDYRQDEPPAVSSLASLNDDVWDTGVWDTAKWGVADDIAYFSALGGQGIGRSVAIAMSGASLDDTYLASWDIGWDTGGFL